MLLGSRLFAASQTLIYLRYIWSGTCSERLRLINSSRNHACEHQRLQTPRFSKLQKRGGVHRFLCFFIFYSISMILMQLRFIFRWKPLLEMWLRTSVLSLTPPPPPLPPLPIGVQGHRAAISSSSGLWSVSQNDKVTQLGGSAVLQERVCGSGGRKSIPPDSVFRIHWPDWTTTHTHTHAQKYTQVRTDVHKQTLAV